MSILVTTTPRAGKVYLVGAGPGSADLITLRGLKILQSADLVLADALVSEELLKEARHDAILLPVGKRGYCIGSTRQETIHEAMVRHARAGLTICRLKCGDPCIFGRGGEEAEALAAAGIEHEIVPGVTSASGACAAVGIPLTHREHGQSITFVTGHQDPDSPECRTDWATLAQLPTLVFYMALRHVGKIAARLAASGMDPATLAALIESGTLPEQRIFEAPLDAIGTEVDGREVHGPALFVIGSVVGIRHMLPKLAQEAGQLEEQQLSRPGVLA